MSTKAQENHLESPKVLESQVDKGETNLSGKIWLDDMKPLGKEMGKHVSGESKDLKELEFEDIYSKTEKKPAVSDAEAKKIIEAKKLAEANEKDPDKNTGKKELDPELKEAILKKLEAIRERKLASLKERKENPDEVPQKPSKYLKVS